MQGVTKKIQSVHASEVLQAAWSGPQGTQSTQWPVVSLQDGTALRMGGEKGRERFGNWRNLCCSSVHQL